MQLGSAGLGQAWEKHLERERLRELRFNLLGGHNGRLLALLLTST